MNLCLLAGCSSTFSLSLFGLCFYPSIHSGRWMTSVGAILGTSRSTPFITWSTGANTYAPYSKVIGEGNQKTVVIDDDEPFNEGMIPYRTFKGTSFYYCTLGCANHTCTTRVRMECLGSSITSLRISSSFRKVSTYDSNRSILSAAPPLYPFTFFPFIRLRIAI